MAEVKDPRADQILRIVLTVRGDIVESLVGLIQDLVDDNISLDAVGWEGGDLEFLYSPGLDSTTAVFSGIFWIAPVAGIIQKLKAHGVPHSLYSTRPLLFVIQNYPAVEEPDVKKPTFGNLQDLVNAMEAMDPEPEETIEEVSDFPFQTTLPAVEFDA